MNPFQNQSMEPTQDSKTTTPQGIHMSASMLASHTNSAWLCELYYYHKFPTRKEDISFACLLV